jgi:hypothetical protein
MLSIGYCILAAKKSKRNSQHLGWDVYALSCHQEPAENPRGHQPADLLALRSCVLPSTTGGWVRRPCRRFLAIVYRPLAIGEWLLSIVCCLMSVLALALLAPVLAVARAAVLAHVLPAAPVLAEGARAAQSGAPAPALLAPVLAVAPAAVLAQSSTPVLAVDSRVCPLCKFCRCHLLLPLRHRLLCRCAICSFSFSAFFTSFFASSSASFALFFASSSKHFCPSCPMSAVVTTASYATFPLFVGLPAAVPPSPPRKPYEQREALDAAHARARLWPRKKAASAWRGSLKLHTWELFTSKQLSPPASA